jgi:hypothetical protein
MKLIKLLEQDVQVFELYHHLDTLNVYDELEICHAHGEYTGKYTGEYIKAKCMGANINIVFIDENTVETCLVNRNSSYENPTSSIISKRLKPLQITRSDLLYDVMTIINKSLGYSLKGGALIFHARTTPGDNYRLQNNHYMLTLIPRDTQHYTRVAVSSHGFDATYDLTFDTLDELRHYI